MTSKRDLNFYKGLHILAKNHSLTLNLINNVIFREFILTQIFQYVKVNQYQVTPLKKSNNQVELAQEKPFYNPFMWGYTKVIELKLEIAKGNPFDLKFYELRKLNLDGSISQA